MSTFCSSKQIYLSATKLIVMNERMKKSSYSLAVIILLVIATACSSTTIVHAPKPLPPGQAKKVTGIQSAKPYAPGQQKNKKN